MGRKSIFRRKRKNKAQASTGLLISIVPHQSTKMQNNQLNAKIALTPKARSSLTRWASQIYYRSVSGKCKM